MHNLANIRKRSLFHGQEGNHDLRSVHHVRVIAFFLLRGDLDHVVNPEDRDGSFGGKLEALDLAHGRLKDARLLVVPHSAINEIQAIPDTRDRERCLTLLPYNWLFLQ